MNRKKKHLRLKNTQKMNFFLLLIRTRIFHKVSQNRGVGKPNIRDKGKGEGEIVWGVLERFIKTKNTHDVYTKIV